MEKEQLTNWIRYLISIDKLYLLYKTKEWKLLKKEVQRDQHFECQECLKEGKLTKVTEDDPVHHRKEVRKFPQLAFSKYFINDKGEEEVNLDAVCFECHNIIHNRFKKRKPFNEEKW